jgi:hypothetical protein
VRRLHLDNKLNQVKFTSASLVVEMKNLHRIFFGVSLLLIVDSWATCHNEVEHEIGQIPRETRAGMSDFDWIGVQWR